MITAVIRILTACLALGWTLPASASPPPATALNAYPADRLLPFWRQYAVRYEDKTAPFTPAYRLDPVPDGATDRSGFWLEAPGARLMPLGADAQGYLVLPPEAHAAGFVTRRSRLLHDADRPLPAIRLEFHAQMQGTRRHDVSDLAALVRELDQLQRSSMGLAALMAPRFDVIVFRFDGPAPDGWHVTARGERRELDAIHDTLFLRMTARTARAGGEIVLGAPPRRIVVEAR